MVAAAERSSLRHACPLSHPSFREFTFPVRDGRPLTIRVPTELHDNLRFRERLLDGAKDRPEAQAALLAMVQTPTVEGFLVWLWCFGYTYRQNRVTGTGKVVSITDGGADVAWLPWPIQEKLAGELISCIENGRNVAVDKARDMGMSWLIIAIFVWMCLYRPNVNFLVMSRVEELVDNAEDPDSLFWKIDYLIAKLPGYLRPRLKRARMRPATVHMHSTIIGKSTSAQQGRAGRKTAALIDEAASMEHFQKIWVSMRHTTPCMIANSTPLGPGFFAKLTRARNVHQLRAAFWDHPMKGAGRYEHVNAQGDIEIRSPWLDQQVAEAVDPLEISQEILMDHQGSGYVVFPDLVLTRQRTQHCQPPWYIGEIEHDDHDGEFPLDLDLRAGTMDRIAFNDEAALGHWRLWLDFEQDERGVWRPPQTRTYALGIDIAWGLARANSTIVAKDIETGEQVATYANAQIEPAEFARVAVMAGRWFGGAHGCAFLCWEANGAGQNFGKGVVGLRYPWIYYNRDERTKSRQRDADHKYGWHSNPHRKQLIAGMLRTAMARDRFIVRDEAIIEELADYIFNDDGSIGPADLKDESGAAKATHGDRAIGAMLAEYASRECFRCKPPERPALPGSPAFRRKRVKELEAHKAKQESRYLRALRRG